MVATILFLVVKASNKQMDIAVTASRHMILSNVKITKWKHNY